MKTIGLKFGLGLLLAGFLQTAALGWMVYDQVSLLRHGAEIILKTTPVDPRSLFRGHYVRLHYEVSTLDLGVLEGEKTFRRGDAVNVLVQPGGAGEWIPASVHAAGSTMETPAGMVLLRGRVRYCQRSTGTKSQCAKLAVKYGVEKYFIYKERALELERSRNKRPLRIVLAVSAKGQAAVKGIEEDGRRIYNEPLF